MDDVEQFDDPVLAYDRLAQAYSELARRRERYLIAVEREILCRLPSGSESLLDIGAGDGSRAMRIAAQAGISRIVLVEPSEKMIALAPKGAEIWNNRAEDLGARQVTEKFDVITCLWNVLGHIRGTARRVQALSGAGNLVSEKGAIFADVIHRYNTRSYGLLPSATRWIYDQFVRSDSNGDINACWNIGGSRISTYGHVFTHDEVMHIAWDSGLKLEERVGIDYEVGQVRPRPSQANLLYLFRRRS